MPRLFAALSIPSEVAQALAGQRGGIFGARWIDPTDYHVTLRFVGDVDAQTARDIADALVDVRRPPAAVEFAGLSWFGGGKPRAIIAAIRPSSPLIDLQDAIERRLRRVGLPPETRNFAPHVTLARLRGVGPAAVADYLGARGGAIAPSFEASRFALYSARESVGGGPYLVEVDYPLR